MDNKEILSKYVYQNFDIKEEKIALKLFHSFRVADFCLKIATGLNLPQSDQKLAYDIGLLHDFSRFKQWTMYKTFQDYKSFDHGSDAAFELIKNEKITMFDINRQDYQVIYHAIYNHNKKSIIDGLSDRELLFSKIIRDADKLDILRLVLQGKVKINYEENGVSDSVLNDFMQQKIVINDQVKTKLDEMLQKLALIWDFNFSFSFQEIRNMNFLDLIKDKYLELLSIEEDKILFDKSYQFIKDEVEKKASK